MTALLVSPACFPNIVVDGRADEQDWQTALQFDDFRLINVGRFEVPPYHTVIKLSPQPQALFIAMWMEIPPHERTRGRSPKDAEAAADPAYVHIDFEGLGRTANVFSVSLSGSRSDAVILNQTEFIQDWDAVWYAAIGEDEHGWTVEFEIPWTVAPEGLADGTHRTIGLSAGRYVKASSTQYGFPAIPFPSPTYVQDFKKIVLPRFSATALDILPYSLLRTDLLRDSTQGKIGADLFWMPDARNRLGLTVNPDFAQVESDELVVDFSAIETFFSDKRPFFTERLELFDVRAPRNDRLVHTRRIGAAADSGPARSSDVRAALKYTTSIASHEFGIFAVDEEDARQSQGRNFAAMRWNYKGSKAGAGYLATLADRPALDRSAVVQAIDFNARLAERLSLRGQAISSNVRAGTMDEPTSRTSRGYGAWGSVAFQSESAFQALTARWLDKKLNFNDLGYQERNDYTELRSESELTVRQSGRWLNVSNWRLDMSAAQNSNGTALREHLQLWNRLEWSGGRMTKLTYRLTGAGIDDLLSRGHGDVKLPAHHSVGLRYQAAKSGQWRGALELNASQNGLRSKYSVEAIGELSWLPMDSVSLTGKLHCVEDPDWLIWREASRFASFRRNELYALLDLDWYPSRRQELRLRLQWIGLSARDAVPYVLDTRAQLVDDTQPQPDFTIATLGVQVRYRFELAPLSELFLVYSRGGDQTLAARHQGLSSDIFAATWDNVTAESIVAKLQYRF